MSRQETVFVIERPPWLTEDDFQLRAHRMLEHFDRQDFGGTYIVQQLDGKHLVICTIPTVPRRDEELFLVVLRAALTGYIFHGGGAVGRIVNDIN